MTDQLDELARMQIEDGETFAYSQGVMTKFPATSPVNLTGIQPIEFKVLIDPTPIEDKIGSIIIPESTKESEKYAQTKGRVVARSPHAFNYVEQPEWDAVGAKKPAPGDVVLYAKYAGIRVKGKDGKEYLLVNDKDICATIEE